MKFMLLSTVSRGFLVHIRYTFLILMILHSHFSLLVWHIFQCQIPFLYPGCIFLLFVFGSPVLFQLFENTIISFIYISWLIFFCDLKIYRFLNIIDYIFSCYTRFFLNCKTFTLKTTFSLHAYLLLFFILFILIFILKIVLNGIPSIQAKF